LASIVAVPVPLFASLPCKQSWNLIDANQATIIFSTTFQKGSRKPIPQ
jgi:hypothetical protein